MNRFVSALALLLCLAGTARAQLSRPVMLAKPPDVAECRGIVNSPILDIVYSAKRDPLESFEQRRRSKRRMVEASPVIECQSKLWNKVFGSPSIGNYAVVPEGAEGLGLRSTDPGSDAFYRSLSAALGPDTDPASGVEAYQGEMQIAVNPNDPQQLVAGANSFYRDPNCVSPTGTASNTYGTQALYGSTDGGATWKYRCAPWPATLTGGLSSATAWFGSDPSLAWDAQGHAYAVYMLLSEDNFGSAGAAIVIARSSDAGNSWTPLGTIVNNIASTVSFDDKEMVAVDNSAGPASAKSHPGRIYVVWDENNVERVAHSDDGVTWTTVPLPPTGFGQYDIGGNVVVGPDGTVYVIWNRLIYPSSQTGEKIVFSKSVDGGTTWSAPAVVVTESLLSFGSNNTPPAQESRGINAFGSIGIDANPASAYFGNLYIAYSDFPSGTSSGTDINTYVVTSSNGGTTWSPPVRANDDSGTATQFFPWLSVDQSDGSVNVSWYDTRVDPAANRKAQLFYARSVNGAVSFEPNLLIDDNGGTVWTNAVAYSDLNTSDNASRNANQYGDYSGIVAANRQVHPFWTDSRQFFPNPDTTVPSRREDAASATVVHCAPPAAMATPSVLQTCGVPGTRVSWFAPAGWGTNATSGTYSIYRSTSAVFPGGTPLVSGLTATTYSDSTGTIGVTYYYFVRATNNCPGTALTPMSSDSPASAPIVFGEVSGACGTLNGTVSNAGVPLGGVVVTAGTNTVLTSSSGFYQFVGIASGTYTVSASANGYVTGSANGVVVSDSATTTQDFNLAAAGSSACVTDTTQADFAAGTPSSLDLGTNPGDVRLQGMPFAAEQQQATASLAGRAITDTIWTGQSFVPASSGNLAAIDFKMFNAGGSTGVLTVEIRNNNGGLPGPTVLGSGTIAPFTNGNISGYTVTFSPRVALTAGTTYHIVLRQALSGTYGVIAACDTTSGGCNPYAAGSAEFSTNSGTTWTAVNTDLYFVTYLDPGTFVSAGDLVSSLKDSNPITGTTTNWSTLSWTAATPANTSVRFQVAASNAASGPFAFVGPDGTASTFFTTSGASLAQFNGNRYLRYRAFLATSASNATPALSDVSICEQLVDCSATATPAISAAASVCGASTGNTASGPAGAAAYSWSIANGTITGGATSQTVTFTAGTSGEVSLMLTTTQSGGCHAARSVNIPISIPPTPSISAGGATSFCSGGSVTLTSSSAAGNQWYRDGLAINGETNATIDATTSGSYTVVVTASGCPSFPSPATAVTVTPIPATPAITAGGPTTFCAGGSVTLTSSSASGNQWLKDGNPIGGATGTSYVATAGGDYRVQVTLNGCSSSVSGATTVTALATPPPATPTMTASGPTTFCAGGSVTLNSSSASGNQWFKDGVAINGATGPSYAASASGSYTVTVTSGSCTSTPSSATSVTVTPIPATPSISAGGPTAFCSGSSVTLTSSSATGNQWLKGGVAIGGATGPSYAATTTGAYTVVVTGSGCSSAPSAATNVTADAMPPTPSITAGGPTTFCSGGSVLLTSSNATGNQWLKDGVAIGGATGQTYNATATGNYTVQAKQGGCASAPSAAVAVTVNPTPAKPAITITTGSSRFCYGSHAVLTSSAAATYQWLKNGSPIAGETGQSLYVWDAGNYTVRVGTTCTSTSDPQPIVVDGVPPVITADGPLKFCEGGSVTLHSSGTGVQQWYLAGKPITTGGSGSSYTATVGGSYSVTSTDNCGVTTSVNSVNVEPLVYVNHPTIYGAHSACRGSLTEINTSYPYGNQWFLNGVAVPGTPDRIGANGVYYVTVSGTYTVQVTNDICTGTMSDPFQVTILDAPDKPVITADGTPSCGGSVTLHAPKGDHFSWLINNNFTNVDQQTFTATTSGDYQVIVRYDDGCTSVISDPFTLTFPPGPPATITGVPAAVATGAHVSASVTATTGATYHWTAVNGTINGSASGTTVDVTAGPAGSLTLTALVTAGGCSTTQSVTASVTAPGGTHNFDANGDTTIDPADVFYLVNFLFTGGPAPAGAAGPVSSGDANGDGVVDPADIFYVVNYLFTDGPRPLSLHPIASSSALPAASPLHGSLTLGSPTRRNGKYVVPVIVDASPGAPVEALAMKVRVTGASAATIRRVGAAASLSPRFETSHESPDTVSYVISFGARVSGVVAELELVPDDGAPELAIEFDPAVTMLTDGAGLTKATAAGGTLTLRGARIATAPHSRSKDSE